MRAVVYQEPFQVAVQEVPDPHIEQPNDVIVRITSTCICGTDLYVYGGRTAAQPGTVFGHEDLGIVEEVGAGVVTVEQGDRVVVPFAVACGFCRNCRAGSTGACLTLHPSGRARGAYGSVTAGPCAGGQAEYLRVPYADVNCLPLPPGTQHESDYVLLADVFPSGYHGCELAGVSPGETVAVFGAGPVGLMAAYCALLCGASRVFVVDRVPERLAKARDIGAVAVDSSAGDPAQQIKELTGGEGTDKGVDAVGFPITARTGEGEEPATVLHQLVQTVRPTGGLGVPGPCVHWEPVGVVADAEAGTLLVAIDTLFEKGLRVGTGRADVKRYDRQLRDLITEGRATPSFVVSHELPLDEAPLAYRKADQCVDGCTKVVLKPDAG
ncbi:glutathione-independent formaldehyde dehydrogenase [Geodermatophilus bullaregiensis]|uniref:glutathione-independent formaldehyde dehydrogenase n=1 Tax=Geodermatophilus bullaregiensis TaxID=1564160 RepID=UPI00195B90CD|nr:glutathione-independent formaldehyde dehydrogenase [Geodermatophilus bullaregiensis]MBM7809074.1 glutathione-independent formaldehyde dehydrogenase [Geodermatophilus bullaregiensis]